MSKLKQSGLFWIWITIVLLVIDQVTKQWALTALAEGNTIQVMPHFDFRLAFNYGAAFSFLADAGGWQKWGLSIFAVCVSVALIVWLSRIKSTDRWLSISLALVLSGALGNAYDRIAYGYVIDFIDWFWEKGVSHWPTFNIADTAISIGAAMLIIESLFMSQSESSDSKNSAAK
ncbi:MAG: signal peptidase II [Gammaproteobacteria bacterium]|nr:signal peptidase II [Gammaproteobacteria bacterium]